MIGRSKFVRNDRAASGVEFALVVPVLFVFLFGTIDVGRYMWTLNQAEKATQMGARFAVVTDPVASGLSGDFTFEHGSIGGDPVLGCGDPNEIFCQTVCDDSACTPDWGYDEAAFDNLVDRMRRFYAAIQPENVTITYRNVGLGFAGDPNGPDVAALTTVELAGLTFEPIILFGGTINLPTIKALLTLEDAEGIDSN